MNHNSLNQTEPNPKGNAVGLERSLSLITLPFMVGLVALRQVENRWENLGRLTESLLQGEQLPILERRCSGTQNSENI
jgi:TRAP-type C4-dicarboxylate transport system permease small subunit